MRRFDDTYTKYEDTYHDILVLVLLYTGLVLSNKYFTASERVMSDFFLYFFSRLILLCTGFVLEQVLHSVGAAVRANRPL
jgi:Ni,Fe-hydrogenase I cytochrome b subunit